jgi:hypothetical protein
MTAQNLTSMVFLKISRREKVSSSLGDRTLLLKNLNLTGFPYTREQPFYFYFYYYYFFTQNGVSSSLIRCRLNAGFQIIWPLGTAIFLATGCDF